MPGLVIRSLIADEAALFESVTDPGRARVGLAAFGRTYHAMANDGDYRPEWSWVALRDGRVVARAAWWAPPGQDQPQALDWLDFDDPAAAVALLQAAPLRSDYHLLLPPGWRDHPAVRDAAQARLTVAHRAGMRPFVERHYYRWTPTAGLPDRPTRLTYRPEPDDDVVLNVLRRVEHGTLDAHANRVVAASGVDAAARADLRILRQFPSPRAWWRLAATAGGELVGLIVPARNHDDHPVIGLVGVVAEQRGHGYGYDLLVEGTHLLVAEGADHIIASTDVANTPMAAAFARAGYPVTRVQVILAWPPDEVTDAG